MTDAGLAHLNGMKALAELSLQATEITDEGLAHLRHMAELTTLRLGGTQVSDDGLLGLSGLPLTGAELKTLAKKLKQHCGTGGAVKDGIVEIQGDQRQQLLSYLQKAGYTVKISGG